MHPPILCIWFKVFWLNTTFPWFVRLPTLPTCSLWFLAVPQTENAAERDPMSHEKTLCGTRQPSCTRFHNKLSRNVSSNGRTTGRSVCIAKETTLKGIRVSDVKINNCIFAEPNKSPLLLYSPRNIYIYIYTQGVPGGMCQTSGGCSLC